MIEYLTNIIGAIPPGLSFLYYLFANLLLLFVFHIIEHIFEIIFSRFFK